MKTKIGLAAATAALSGSLLCAAGAAAETAGTALR
jgi:hypothetical protein